MAPIALHNAIDHQDAIILQRQAAPATAAPLSSGVIIGIAVAGATVLLFLTGVTTYLIIRKRRNHHAAMLELEQRALPISHQMEEAPRPISGIRCGRLVPLPQSQAGWDALGSNDTINEPERAKTRKGRRRNSVSLPKRMKARLSFKHLSAILESPRLSRHPSHGVESVTEILASPERTFVGIPRFTGETPPQPDEGLPGSPRPDVLPSFAIKSPARYGAAIANDERPMLGTMRSVSVGVLDADGAVFGAGGSNVRPQMHARSISLGAPLTRPPSGPVPPLPVIAPLNLKANDSDLRQGVCVSRMSSSSSIDSAGSSILVTSPILNRSDGQQPLSSPTVEEIVAEKDNAELKSVVNRQWSNPRVAGPRPTSSMRVEKSRSSIRGNIVRYSSDSLLSSSSSDTHGRNRLSIPRIGTADRVSISRVSSTNSLASNSVQKIETPPRKRRSQVSASGSPTERKKKNGILRDISGNAIKTSPHRQMSISTQDSLTSSNGNPFHWEHGSSNSLTKPSAMKGSPNARKGHRRQNCVRISTLTPQVLGPPGSRSRSSSPAPIVMDEIIEERESDELKRETDERRKVERVVAQERRRSRPPMPNRTISSESNMSLRVQTLRASLTPSSPTFSAWNAYHEGSGLPSHPSDTSISASSYRRCDSRQSEISPLRIPKFPTPSKARASVALSQIDTAPMPEFSIDMESPVLGFDERKTSSPFALDLSSDEPMPVSPNETSPIDFSPVSPIDLPSSPPLPISKTKAYDPAWPMVSLPAPKDEYDPASPPLVWTPQNNDEHERSSSYFLPFALSPANSEETSPKSRPLSYVLPDEPPCSPKTIPETSFPPIPERNPAREKLTSENASSIMARMPGKSTSTSSFLGGQVPVLSPPDSGYEDLPLPQYQPQRPAPVANMGHSRQRSVSNVNFKPPRAGPPAPALPTIPQSDDSPPPAPVPAPLNISQETKPEKHVPKGPRSAPGRSVLKNAMALRRMNSEARCDEARESRNYFRLGREASPLLPFIGAHELNDSESCNDLFDFDFDTRAGADEDQDLTPTRRSKNASAMDEISMDAIEKNLGGALAGFDAEYQAWSSPYGKGTEAGAQRSSSVWEDGEKYWSNSMGTAQSLQPPQFQYPAAGVHQTPTRPHEETTVDPRLLSTPASKYGSSPAMGGGSLQATPMSLYDAEGFLKRNA